jgi:hypothetical protein
MPRLLVVDAQELDRDVPPDPWIVGEIHGAHPALAKPAFDTILSDERWV